MPQPLKAGFRRQCGRQQQFVCKRKGEAGSRWDICLKSRT